MAKTHLTFDFEIVPYFSRVVKYENRANHDLLSLPTRSGWIVREALDQHLVVFTFSDLKFSSHLSFFF